MTALFWAARSLTLPRAVAVGLVGVAVIVLRVRQLKRARV